MTSITIVSLCYKPEAIDAPNDHFLRIPLQTAELVAGHGVKGDRKGGNPDRQMNIMSSESLQILADAGFDVSPGAMGEQMVIQGEDVRDLPAGTLLHLGSEAAVEIIKLRNGCERLAKFQQKPPQTYDGRLGVLVKVVQGGIVRVGDTIHVHRPSS